MKDKKKIQGAVFQKLNRLLESDSESADDEPLEKLKQSLDIIFWPSKSKSKAGKKHERKKASDMGRRGRKKASDMGRRGHDAASSYYINGSVSDDHGVAKEYGGSEQAVKRIVRDIWDVADAAIGCMIENDSSDVCSIETTDSSDNRGAKKLSQRRKQKIGSLVRGFEERGSAAPANAKENNAAAALPMATVRKKSATRRKSRYGGGDKDADITVKFMDVYGNEEYTGGDVYEGTDTPLIVSDQ